MLSRCNPRFLGAIEDKPAEVLVPVDIDVVSAATSIAKENVERTFEQVEKMAKSTGISAKLEKLGIKISQDQAITLLAILGAWQIKNLVMQYKKEAIMGAAGIYLLLNKDKFLKE